MMKYKIYAGLSGGFGGAEFKGCEYHESEDAAAQVAYDYACEDYDGYAGLYGLRGIDDIMSEDGVDEEEAQEIYNDEHEGWLEYWVEECTGDDDDDYSY